MIYKISTIDYLILKLSYLFGAIYFKKYWPVTGSFWRKNHINKNNTDDLQNVIDNANSYSAIHIQNLITEVIIYIPVVILVICYQNQQAKYSLMIVPSIWFIHFYALLIHHHNRVRAKISLTKLMSDPEQIQKQVDKTEVITIDQNCSDQRNGGPITGFVVHFDYKFLSPILPTYQQAKDYRSYLYQLWSKDRFKISEAIFINDVANIYRQWKNQC